MPSCVCCAWTRRRGAWTSRSSSTRIAGTAAWRQAFRRSKAVIDLKLLRTSPQQVRAALARRGDPTVVRLLDELEALDMRRRALTGQLDQLKAERNEAAKADARLMKEKGELPPEVREGRRKLGERIDTLEVELRSIEAAIEEKLLYVPNLPLPDVRDGDEANHKGVRTWGEPAPRGGKPHWELGDTLGILDLERVPQLPVRLPASRRGLAPGADPFVVRLVSVPYVREREVGHVEQLFFDGGFDAAQLDFQGIDALAQLAAAFAHLRRELALLLHQTRVSLGGLVALRLELVELARERAAAHVQRLELVE